MKQSMRQDPGYKMYDKEYRMGAEKCPKCKGDKKKCPGGKTCPMMSKKDMSRKSPYADGMCGKRDDIAADINAILINDAEREDKPCGNSYIPEAAKCRKGRGTAKASTESLKKRALAKEQEVNKGRSIAEQKKRESFPKDKEYKRLRQLENEMNKEAALKKEKEINKKKKKSPARTLRNVAAAGLFGAAVASEMGLPRKAKNYMGRRKLKRINRRGEKYLNLYKNKKTIPDPFA